MISGPVVVDASVVVEYLVQLTLTQAASRLFARMLTADEEGGLFAPDLIYSESASALRKLVRLRAIDAHSGDVAIDRLTRLPIAVAGTGPLMRRVWALRGILTPYDACYVALAERLRAPFVTADRPLTRSRVPGGPKLIFLPDIDA